MSDNYIEDRVAKLEGIVQGLHELVGHKWHRGEALRLSLHKECACGASERVEREEYEGLPARYELALDL